MRNSCSLAIVFIFVLAVGSSTAAQEYGMEDYGIQDTNYHFVSAEEFSCTDPNVCEWVLTNANLWFNRAAFDGVVTAPMRLPTGALLTGMTVIYRDDSASDNIQIKLYRNWVSSLGTTGAGQVGLN